MLRVLIIEDEIPAQQNLIRLLDKQFDDLVVVGRIDSVEGAIEWLEDKENRCDIIFMDVELADGKCFEIFKNTTVSACVVITTAYDHYAIEAFKSGALDYLLKPLGSEELEVAVERCREKITRNSLTLQSSSSTLTEDADKAKLYKRRFTVKLGNKILIIPTGDIAYFYSEDKTNYLITHQGAKYIMDLSLEKLSVLLDPTHFFRLTRGCISSVGAIDSISKHFSSRLKINLTPPLAQELYVSRGHIPEFIEWIELGGQ